MAEKFIIVHPAYMLLAIKTNINHPGNVNF